MKTWQFEPLDSSFFRGARSFQQNEQGFLESQFPPTAQTLAGVIRSAIAESKGVNWASFHNGGESGIADLIGKHADDAGQLSFAGPYLIKDGKRLYPVPLHVLYSTKVKDPKKAWSRLAPSSKTYQTDMMKLPPSEKIYHTDMIKHRLPEVVEKLEGAKPLEDAWLDVDNLNRVLNGKDPERFYKKEDLFVYENRTGIARDNRKRTTNEGALFFTRHIRLKHDVRLAMDVSGADDVMPASMVRLGGEGRMAHLDTNHVVASGLQKHDGNQQFILVLLTHGDFNGQSKPDLPEGLSIVSACVGKAVREGGWDYAKRQPKPLKSLVPAGSVFFIEGDASILKDNHIGERTPFGYGECILGNWGK